MIFSLFFFNFSFFFIFFHFLSFSFIFHFLSFSFNFFHFLSFSFSLLGAQNLIFFGPSISVTISLDNSYVRNQFLGPSRVVVFKYLLGPLFLFSYVFSPVFCLFSCFLFSFFEHFLFISSFFDLLMFFIFFFHFSEEKVSSFLFSCISFKYFLADDTIRV